jgi:hypothetical protein
MRATGFTLLATLAACQGQGLDDADDIDAYEETAAALWCGTNEPSANQKLAIELETSRIPDVHTETARGATINVYVHVIRRDLGRANGDVPDTAIADQLRVLDNAYASTGFSFKLAAIDRSTNLTWFAMTPGSAAEAQAKQSLRRGTARDLNLYIAEPGNGFLGYATFPSQYTVAPKLDGVVMLHSVLPAGAAAPFNLGDQAVHEVGHWLGLYHTFQADCGGNGDYVLDTPSTSMPAFGCPMGRDTCGTDGDDPVRNYMDSTDDACMNAFSAGQIDRINTMFTAYRRL